MESNASVGFIHKELWLVIVPEGGQVVVTVTGAVSCRDGSVTMEMLASGSISKVLGNCLVPLPETWHTRGSVTTGQLRCHIHYRTDIAN